MGSHQHLHAIKPTNVHTSSNWYILTAHNDRRVWSRGKLKCYMSTHLQCPSSVTNPVWTT
jgi:hypothetical protein